MKFYRDAFFKGLGRVAKNILRLGELVTIISKQFVIVPEQNVKSALILKKFYATWS